MMADTGRWPVAWSTIRSAAVGAGNSGIEQDGRKSDLRVGVSLLGHLCSVSFFEPLCCLLHC